MKEVKPSKKPLAIYYGIVLLVLLVLNGDAHQGEVHISGKKGIFLVVRVVHRHNLNVIAIGNVLGPFVRGEQVWLALGSYADSFGG